MNRKYINIAASVMFMSLMACTDEVKSPETSIVDENAITFTVYPESAQVGTRGFSKGTHVDQLIYMIYKWDDEKNDFEPDDYYLNGQSYAGVENCKALDISSFPYTIKLIPNPEDNAATEYKIVCWAQKANSEFYDLTAFPNVTVKYEKEKIGNEPSYYANNEEERDAFHCVETFTASAKGTPQQLVLKRPFAQINIGTSGWDYEGLASVKPSERIVKYSMISIKGVADQFNALENTAEASEDNLEITFDWAKIPAYANVLDDDDLDLLTGVRLKDAGIKDDGTDGIFKEKYVEEFLTLKLTRPISSSKNPEVSELSDDEVEELESEEKAAADAPSDDYEDFDDSDYGYAKYISWKDYDALCARYTGDELVEKIFTETFKYLSMSYVLVPTASENTGSTVEIEFDCAETAGGPGIYSINNSNVLSLKNVPVGQNCRTNIVATDGTGFFMSANEMKVGIYSETFSDYYQRLASDITNWGDSSDLFPGDKLDGIKDNDGENGYNWPGGEPDPDIDPDYGKLPYGEALVTLLNNDNTKLIDETNNIVHSIKYFRDDVKFTISTNSNFSYDYYLWDEKLDETNKDGKYSVSTSGSNKTFTFTPEYLDEIRVQYNLIKTVLPLEESETEYRESDGKLVNKFVDVPDIEYYPFKFTAKPTLTGNIENADDYRYDDQEIMIRWYTAYKFTFSETSKDEGCDVWNKIGTFKHTGSTNADEKDYFFIGNGERAQSKHIDAVSRKGSLDGNNILVAFPDHFRLRGAATASGHWIIIKNLKENCKITAKIGRDKGIDNTGNQSTGYKTKDRGLHVNWEAAPETLNAWDKDDTGHDKDEVDIWPYIPINDTNLGTKIEYYENKEANKTVYLNNETKIYKSVDTEISQDNLNTGKDVTVYVCDVGHSYYWILLSEPD